MPFTEYSFRNAPPFFQKNQEHHETPLPKSVTHLTGLQEEDPGSWV